jgi:outer membrane protein OmpA-like peptidoglycan-associated protein
MKKIILILIAAAGTWNVTAQNINPETDYVGKGAGRHKTIVKPDSMLSSWCLDVNLVAGALSQGVASKNMGANYLNPVSANTTISKLKFHDGSSYGIDAEVGYFFGHKKHFGVGAGLMYMYQQANATIDRFHIEYQSTDVFSNVFRQEITATHSIKEKFSINNFNIPLLLKYKTRIAKNVGFTADAGLLINLVEQNHYSTNATFDYEAVYQYTTGGDGNIHTAYDNSPSPAQNDLLLTKGRYVNDHTIGNIQDYFNSLRGQGYNVGLGVRPKHSSGNVSMNGSVGILLRPAISVYLSDMIALNFGAYYIYQDFTHSAQSNYVITNKVGDYNSVLNSTKSVSNNSYGVSVGVRVFFPHKEREEALVIPDMPTEQIAENHEEPEDKEVGEVASPVNIDISTPILFDLDKSVIKHSGYAILEEAVTQLKENPQAYVVIHGYTDITGPASYNRTLSKRRAQAVKNYLQKRGVSSKHLKTIGHGAKFPAASNSTRAGRAQNRRVIMKLKQGEGDE